MLIESLIRIRILLPDGERILEPGEFIALPDLMAQKLLQEAGGRVKEMDRLVLGEGEDWASGNLLFQFFRSFTIATKEGSRMFEPGGLVFLKLDTEKENRLIDGRILERVVLEPVKFPYKR